MNKNFELIEMGLRELKILVYKDVHEFPPLLKADYSRNNRGSPVVLLKRKI